MVLLQASRHRAGCWAYSVYNKHFLPKAYADPAEGGLLKEYEWLTNHVTMWDVAIERQAPAGRDRGLKRICERSERREMPQGAFRGASASERREMRVR